MKNLKKLSKSTNFIKSKLIYSVKKRFTSANK